MAIKSSFWKTYQKPSIVSDISFSFSVFSVCCLLSLLLISSVKYLLLSPLYTPLQTSLLSSLSFSFPLFSSSLFFPIFFLFYLLSPLLSSSPFLLYSPIHPSTYLSCMGSSLLIDLIRVLHRGRQQIRHVSVSEEEGLEGYGEAGGGGARGRIHQVGGESMGLDLVSEEVE